MIPPPHPQTKRPIELSRNSLFLSECACLSHLSLGWDTSWSWCVCITTPSCLKWTSCTPLTISFPYFLLFDWVPHVFVFIIKDGFACVQYSQYRCSLQAQPTSQNNDPPCDPFGSLLGILTRSRFDLYHQPLQGLGSQVSVCPAFRSSPSVKRRFGIADNSESIHIDRVHDVCGMANSYSKMGFAYAESIYINSRHSDFPRPLSVFPGDLYCELTSWYPQDKRIPGGTGWNYDR